MDRIEDFEAKFLAFAKQQTGSYNSTDPHACALAQFVKGIDPNAYTGARHYGDGYYEYPMSVYRHIHIGDVDGSDSSWLNSPSWWKRSCRRDAPAGSFLDRRVRRRTGPRAGPRQRMVEMSKEDEAKKFMDELSKILRPDVPKGSVCYCGSIDDAYDAALRILGQTVANKECIVWYMQVASAMNSVAFAVNLYLDGVKPEDMAGKKVGDLMKNPALAETVFTNSAAKREIEEEIYRHIEKSEGKYDLPKLFAEAARVYKHH